jgi:hypothetical protein
MCLGLAMFALVASVPLLGPSPGFHATAPRTAASEQPQKRSLDLPGMADLGGFSHPRFLVRPIPVERAPVNESANQHWSLDSEPPGFSIGPVRAQLGGMPGEHMRFASFKLDQTTVLGASVGASVDGRSAKVVFSWPTGN